MRYRYTIEYAVFPVAFFLISLLLLSGTRVYGGANPAVLKQRKQRAERARRTQQGGPRVIGPSQTRPAAARVAPYVRQRVQYMDIGKLDNVDDLFESMQTPDTEREEIKSLVEVFRKSSAVWEKVGNRRVKEAVVEAFISEYMEKGIAINKLPARYVSLIDDMSRQQPSMLNDPLDKVLRLVAIIEYDFDNGQDKDMMAKRILGEQGYIKNRQRLGL